MAEPGPSAQYLDASPQRAKPVLDSAALRGPFGEFVETVRPETEASDAALLFQALAVFGAMIGRGPHMLTGADRQTGALFIMLVGPTGAGGKGTSYGEVRRVFSKVDETFFRERVLNGFGSGEALISAIGDDTERDKRVLVMESEFVRILTVMERDGSTLSAIIREAWDGSDLSNITKGVRLKATDPHVSVIGHITPTELQDRLKHTARANGFLNRFLTVYTERARLKPDGGNLSDDAIRNLASRFEIPLRFALKTQQMRRNDGASAMWEGVYPQLTGRRTGTLAQATARAAAQTVRLSVLYAVAECSAVITGEHLAAALAAWRYAEDSARYLFGESLGDPVADTILEVLRNSPTGLTRTEISNALQRNVASLKMGQALQLLETEGLAVRERRDTTGRTAEVWRAYEVRN